MSTAHRFLGLLFAFAVAVAPAAADDVPPVQVQLTEREPDAFLVQWFVPSVIPVRATPAPVLPAHCRPEGDRAVLDQSGGRLYRQVYRCPGGLSGHALGIRFPVPNPSIRTVIRLDLLSGERFAHALAPMEDSWQVPELNVEPVTKWLREARGAVVTGARHIFGHWVHVAFLLAVILPFGAYGSIRPVTAFAVGQLIAVGLTAIVGRQFEPIAAEICVAIAVAFLARETLHDAPSARRVAGVAGGAGLFHGLALASLLPTVRGPDGTAWWHPLMLVLGMDAALLVLALTAAAVAPVLARRRPMERLRRALTYLVGGTAVAAGLSLAFAAPTTDRAVTPTSALLPGGRAASSSMGLPGSRRLAPQTPKAPIQSYLAVEPFEVRHEALLRLEAVADEIGIQVADDGSLDVELQADTTRRIGELVAARTLVQVDGEPVDGFIDRVSFMTVTAQGVLPRQTPVREAVDQAFVGVTVVSVTSGIPDEVTLAWTALPDGVSAIPAAVIDPESSRTATLTADAPVLRWQNELMGPPILAVTGVAVESPQLPVPLLSLPLVAVAMGLLVVGARRQRPEIPIAAARVTLALALVAAPLAQIAVALPASVGTVTSTNQARRILASVLPNVYRAFEFRDEEAVYDRLAVAVTGETLTDVYLEHRRALVMEERGGARARVDAVELLDVTGVEPHEDGGFDARAAWTVGGTVTHFGHRHFRQNRYDARVSIVPVDGMWKIRSIEVLQEKRVR